jgi:hypothetical protein
VGGIGLQYAWLVVIMNTWQSSVRVLTAWPSLVGTGKKLPEYWDTAKKLLNNPSDFLESLLKYDKENIQDGVIKRIEPYIAMEEFMPEAVAKVSKACTSICMWVR